MNRQRGISLIDLLVGLFIGLLISLAVYSTAMISEAQRRTSVSSDGTLEAAMNSLYAIQHDVKAAGVGVFVNGQTICPTMNIYKSSAPALLVNGAAVAPAIINAGASDTISDSITIASSTSVLGNDGLPLATGMASASAVMTTANVRGIAVNDMLLVSGPPQPVGVPSTIPCTVMQVTATATAPGSLYSISHASSSPWNPANPTSTFTNAPAYSATSLAFDINQFNWLTDQVVNRQLQSVSLLTGITEVLAENIVMLKAFYGINDGTLPQINQWVPATGVWANPLDATHIGRVRALRIVVVARSQHPVKPTVAGGACDATTVAPTSWSGGPTINLTGDTTWQCYKYRTVSLVVPLKNVIFGA